MPLYKTLAVIFIVYAVLFFILRGVWKSISPLSGTLACMVMTFFAAYDRIYGFEDQLVGVEAIFFLAIGLLSAQAFIPGFEFYWENLPLISGLVLIAYYAYCWTFDHIYVVWFWFTGFTLFLLTVQLLFGAADAGIRRVRERRQLSDDLDEDDWIYDDDWVYEDD